MTSLLKSALLEAHGAAHGFNLREPGASQGAYRASNLGRSVGDDADHVAANHVAFARAVGYPPGRLYESQQVHGREVRRVGAGDDLTRVRGCRADALVTAEARVAIGVRVADCVPLLLLDPDSGAVAAIHAGWRGVAAGVVEAGVRALQALSGARRECIVGAVFPHIGRCCFEVGEEVANALARVSPDATVLDRTRPRPHVDLGALVRAQLLEHGLEPERLERVPGCTRCEPERFFSFRRDGQRSGRHVAAIVARSGPSP